MAAINPQTSGRTNNTKAKFQARKPSALTITPAKIADTTNETKGVSSEFTDNLSPTSPKEYDYAHEFGRSEEGLTNFDNILSEGKKEFQEIPQLPLSGSMVKRINKQEKVTSELTFFNDRMHSHLDPEPIAKRTLTDILGKTKTEEPSGVNRASTL